MFGLDMSYRIDYRDPRLRTFRGAFRLFMGHPSPRLLLFFSLVGILGSVCFWPLTARHIALAASIVLAWPFQEYVLHRFILHARPFTLWRKTVDVGLFHREHHRDPKDLNGFTPLVLFYFTPPVVFLLFRLIGGDAASGFVGLAVWFAKAFDYELAHFTAHAPYRPLTALGRRRKAAHLRHHFVNERFWWEVSTCGIADFFHFLACGIIPWRSAKEVERSRTVFTVLSE